MDRPPPHRRGGAGGLAKRLGARRTGEVGNEAFDRIEFELDRAEMHASAV